MLIKHKEKCEHKQEITTITTSDESHLYWKNHFHKNPLCLRIIADFEADNEIAKSNIGNKTSKIYKQNPLFNRYFIVNQMDDILKSGYYESTLGYNKVDWFVNEVIKLEKNGFLLQKYLKKMSSRQRKIKNIVEMITFVDFEGKILNLNLTKLELTVT